MPDIAILVPVHNRIAITQAGLHSLSEAVNFYKLSSHLYNFFIIIIDDGSTDGTSQWINDNYPSVHVVKGDGNLWWSGAINKGIDYVINHFGSIKGFLLWNDDLEIDQDYFKKLSSLIDDPQFDKTIIASIVYYLDVKDKIFFQGASFNFKTGKGFIINRDKIDTGIKKTVSECQYTGGMGVYIPIEVINSVGRFDNKNFPQYHGDADFTLRAAKKGFRIICHSDIKVWNDRQQTYNSKASSLSGYFKTLTAFRSNYNLKRDIRFYTRHVPIHYALWAVLRKHSLHFRNNVIYGRKKN